MNLTLWGGILAFAGTVIVAVLTAWQARRGARDSPYTDMVQRVKDQDARIDKLQGDLDTVRTQATEATDRAEQAERNAEYLAADLAKITDYLIATRDGILRGEIPPFLPVPRGQNWISDEDFPSWPPSRGLPTIPHDTGVPGVNPPHQE